MSPLTVQGPIPPTAANATWPNVLHTRVADVIAQMKPPPWSRRIIADERQLVTLIASPPGGGNRPHWHSDFDEWWVVLAGTLQWELTGGTTVRANKDDIVWVPRGRDLVTPRARVTIAFDDHTTGSFGPIRPIAIRAVLDELAAAGVSRSQMRLVCANALHRMCRPAELTRLLDEALVAEFGPRLSCHDAEDAAQIADLGATAEHGYPVEVSRLVTDADLTVYVNTNYIRGFTGGWKSVCVGLSTWRSIRVTHDPDGMSMSLQRNRMHAVLDEIGRHLEARLGRRIFKLDTLLADPFQVARGFAGGVDETRPAALQVH